MSLATADPPEEPEALRAFARSCQDALKMAEAAIQLKALEIEKLNLRLEELEASVAEDAAKADAAAPAAPAAPEPPEPRERTKPRRKPLPPHLPRANVVHQPGDNGACACHACGGKMAHLGEDVTEVLDYVPGHFQVIRHVRPKYACEACDVITQAPAPAMPTPRGRATPSTLAHLLVAKYADHLPLYRQSEIFARDGLDLDRSTLSDWVGQAAWLLDPVAAAIARHVFAAEKIHGDDTTLRVLTPGLGKTRIGRLWVYVRDDRLFAGAAAPAAVYFYSPGRGGAHPAAHLATFTGFLQADGYAGFEALFNPARTKPGPITEVACWAHCRRKIFDVWEATKSPIADEALQRIAAVYAIEEKARFAAIGERVAHRAATGPLLDAFFTWAEETEAKLSAKSALAEAFRYTIKRREALTRFVTGGRLEADNNVAENAMRAIAAGRKNYLFAGSDKGGERAPASTAWRSRQN